MDEYKQDRATALAWIEKYGSPSFVDAVATSKVNPNQVWTAWQDQGERDQYAINEYVPNNDDGGREIIGYYITPKPWSSEPGSEALVTARFEDCSDCQVSGQNEDGDDCKACEGLGNKVVGFI